MDQAHAVVRTTCCKIIEREREDERKWDDRERRRREREREKDVASKSMEEEGGTLKVSDAICGKRICEKC